jgi:hypothetical protein
MMDTLVCQFFRSLPLTTPVQYWIQEIPVIDGLL